MTKNKLKYGVLAAALLLSLFSRGDARRAQSVSTWGSVPATPANAGAKAGDKKSSALSRNRPIRLRGASPNVEGKERGPKGDAPGRQSTASAPTSLEQDSPPALDPAIENVEIFPCCDCNRILLDGMFLYPNATLQLFNSTPNSTVTVTLGHGGPGRIGFALDINGPYTDELTFDVTTNGSGNGSRVINFYIKGMELGQSDMVTTVAEGYTNPVPQMEVFACNCPSAQ